MQRDTDRGSLHRSFLTSYGSPRRPVVVALFCSLGGALCAVSGVCFGASLFLAGGSRLAPAWCVFDPVMSCGQRTCKMATWGACTSGALRALAMQQL